MYYRVLINPFDDKAEFSVHGMYTIGYSTQKEFTKVINFVLRDVIGQVVPIALTTYCYLRIYFITKTSYIKNVSFSRTTLTRMVWCAMLPVIFLSPRIVGDVCFTLQGDYYPFWISNIVGILQRVWGFLNLLAFWVFRPSEKDSRDSIKVPLGRSFNKEPIL